jgi:tetratricopeptide (TPR) repeat protein
LDLKMPVGNGRLLTGLFSQFAQLAWRRFLPGRTGNRERLLEAASAYETLGHVHYYLNESLTVIYTAFRTLNLAGKAGDSPQLAQAYANVGVVLGLVPLHRAVERYNRRALTVAEELGQLPVLTYVWLLSGVYESGVGHWAQGQAALEQALALARQLGDRLREGEALNTLGLLSYYQGQFERGIEQFDAVYTLAHQSENLLHEAWAFSGKAGVLLRLGRPGEAVDLAQSALALLAQTADLSEEVRCNVTVAVGKLRLADKERALAAVETAVSLMRESMSTPTTFFTLDAYAGTAEVYLALWAGGDQSMKKKARQAVRRLHGFARVFPFGRPAAWLYQGMWEEGNGRAAKASKAWEKCITLAQKLSMPYEEGLARKRLKFID